MATRITIERHSGERRIARTATKRSALKERHSESAKLEAEDRSSGDRRARRARVDSPRGRAESSSVDRCSDKRQGDNCRRDSPRGRTESSSVDRCSDKRQGGNRHMGLAKGAAAAAAALVAARGDGEVAWD